MCVVIDHPLEPFSWSEFKQDIERCSYPAELCEAGRMADRGPIFRHHLWRAVCQCLERREPFTPHVGKLYLKVV
jgi:hypothetical protein